MIIGPVDVTAIQNVLSALSGGLRRVEAATPDGRDESHHLVRVTVYYVTDKQIRIDIVEAKNDNS